MNFFFFFLKATAPTTFSPLPLPAALLCWGEGCPKFLARRQPPPPPHHALRPRCRNRRSHRTLYRAGILGGPVARHRQPDRRRTRAPDDQGVKGHPGLDRRTGRALAAVAGWHAEPGADQLVLPRRRQGHAECALS